MASKQKFFVCESCGNLLGIIANKGIPVSCCGSEMTELVPNTAEAATEKHLPEVKASEGEISVSVGSVAHPMEDGHHIAFIYVETEQGGQRKALKVGTAPTASFKFIDDKPIAVYAYCNLHGLWKTEL